MKTILVAVGAGILLSPFSRSAQVEVDLGRSRIQVDAKATGHGFTGSLQKYEAKVAGDAATGKPTAFDLKWDFNDLDTADDKRNKEMVKWLGGGKPKGSFSFVKSWNEKADGGNAQGKLTINSVAKDVSFTYTVKREGEWVTIDGKVRLDYQDFKLPIIRSMALMTVDPKLDVRFHIVGKVN